MAGAASCPLQGPPRRAQGITERSDVIPQERGDKKRIYYVVVLDLPTLCLQGPPRVPTGTPSVDFALLEFCAGALFMIFTFLSTSALCF